MSIIFEDKESECGKCKAIADKVKRESLKNITHLVTEVIAEDDKTHFPASAIMAMYMEEVVKVLAMAVKVEIDRDIEEGTPLEEAAQLENTVLEAMFEMLGGAFGADIRPVAIASDQLDDVETAVAETLGKKPSSATEH